MSRTDEALKRWDALTQYSQETRSGSAQATRTFIGSLCFVALAGVALIALFSIGKSFCLTALTTGTLAAIASMSVGAFVGLLFAIPRSHATPRPTTDQSPAPTSENSGKTPDTTEPFRRPAQSYYDNTNLERVSDWLTTVIVGVSLTQFDSLLRRLDQAGTVLSHHMACATIPAPTGVDHAIGHAIIVSYAVLGFMMAYLWIRKYINDEWNIDQFKRESEIARSSAKAEGRYQERLTPFLAKMSRFMDRRSTIEKRVRDEESAPGIPAPLKFDALKLSISEAALKENDDPWKGAFQGASTRQDFRLHASVSDLPVSAGIYRVSLSVTNDPRRSGQKVRYFLHDTFENLSPVVDFDREGTAQLTLLAYGSFTVGAAVYTGTDNPVLLELDLMELPALPRKFRES